MASWSARRKTWFFLGFILFLAIAIGIPVFYVFYEKPTCFDGRQNGGERGRDCGGPCSRLCPADYSMPKVLWSHSSQVVSGVYNSLAYVENPNPAVEAPSIEYVFKLYDGEGILVAERKGRSVVPAGQRFAIFEGTIETGVRVPSRTTFEFTSVPEWTPGSPLTALKAINVDVATDAATPRAEARVRNESIDRAFRNTDVFIILYDENDNRVAYSKTVMPALGPGQTTTLYFTWPQKFDRQVVRKEVLFVEKR